MNPEYLRTIVAATTNPDKVRELETVAKDFRIKITPAQQWAEIRELSPPPNVEETADTFLGNARLKAHAYAQWAQAVVLADDSGLEVDALDGAPGIHSARYGGVDGSAEDRWRKVLQELSVRALDTKELCRKGRFRCSLVLASPDGKEIYQESALEGEILKEPRGNGGFGYDPIVYIPSLGKTLAEVDFDVTCKVGFRAKAARELFQRVLDEGF